MDFLVNDFELWRSCKLPTFHVCLKKSRFPEIGSWDNFQHMLIISHQSFTWKPTPSPVLDLLDTSQKTKAWFRWFRIWSFDFSWSQKFGLIPWGPCGPNKPNPDFFMTDIFSGLCICQCSGKVRSWGCYGNIMAISFFLGNVNDIQWYHGLVSQKNWNIGISMIIGIWFYLG